MSAENETTLSKQLLEITKQMPTTAMTTFDKMGKPMYSVHVPRARTDTCEVCDNGKFFKILEHHIEQKHGLHD